MRQRQPWLVGVLLTAVYAFGIALPALPHRCEEPSPSSLLGMAAGHHHGAASTHDRGDSHGPDSPTRGQPCKCIGHTCCVARAALPASPLLALPVVVVAATHGRILRPAPRIVLPDFIFPPAIGPPLTS
ncbi:MAG TPA: hypothetical protein VH438_06235 [Gemmatimonadales bacterium]|jgi:hypothetical protein